MKIVVEEPHASLILTANLKRDLCDHFLNINSLIIY